MRVLGRCWMCWRLFDLKTANALFDETFRRTSGQNLQAIWKWFSLSLSSIFHLPSKLCVYAFPMIFSSVCSSFYYLLRLFPSLKSFFFRLCLRGLNCCSTQKMLVQPCRKEIGDDYEEYCFTDVMPCSRVQFYWRFDSFTRQSHPSRHYS